jgi:hypothetical protein
MGKRWRYCSLMENINSVQTTPKDEPAIHYIPRGYSALCGTTRSGQSGIGSLSGTQNVGHVTCSKCRKQIAKLSFIR